MSYTWTMKPPTTTSTSSTSNGRIRTLADLNSSTSEENVGTIVKKMKGYGDGTSSTSAIKSSSSLNIDWEEEKRLAMVASQSLIPTTSSSSTVPRSLSLVDVSWETIDPTPNIHALFQAFNDRFFWRTLQSCEVKWSPRMTTCAGVCSYEGRGGLCSIRLSKPLLTLRPRSDLVETLLHEMIHAYLFVTQNNRDRDGHGPNFHSHMHRINAEGGTSISVYHSFHDEVKHHKQHWWRCDGVCRSVGVGFYDWDITRHPFYGWVKRAMNRAPSKNDLWWAEHSNSCGGKFVKVKEPEKIVKPAKNEKGEKFKKTNGAMDKFVVSKKGNGSNDKTETQQGTSTTSVVSLPGPSTKYITETSTNRPSTSGMSKAGSAAEMRFKAMNGESQENMITLGEDNPADCPVCLQSLPTEQMNAHLDLCLN